MTDAYPRPNIGCMYTQYDLDAAVAKALKETFITKSDRFAYIAILADQIFASPDWCASRDKAVELAKRYMDIVDPPGAFWKAEG